MDTIKTFTFDSSMIPSETIDDENEMSTGNESIEDFTPEEELYGGLKNGDGVTCGGVITEIKTIQTKSGSKMAFLTIEDLTGSFDAILFNKAYDKFKEEIQKDSLVAIKGRFSVRDGKRPSITVDNIEPLSDTTSEQDTEPKIEETEVEITNRCNKTLH